MTVTCRECGAPLPLERVNRATEGSPARYCNQGCRSRNQRRITHHMHRARRMGSPVVERVDPIAVFERDAWHCAICRKAAPRKLLGTQVPMAPTLDHRIPLRRRGHHTMDNTRCTHNLCNSLRDLPSSRRPHWIRGAVSRDERRIKKER